MWSWADAELADALTQAAKRQGHFPRDWGTMNPHHLVVHRTVNPLIGHGVVDGYIYGFPDSLYTFVAETWFANPVVALAYSDGLKLFQAERAGFPVVCGIIEASRSRWVNALIKQGATYVKMAIQLCWRADE